MADSIHASPLQNAENYSAFPLDGGCSCGKIRYRIKHTPLIVHCCHCTSCQRETGSAFAINAVIEAQGVTRLASSLPTAPSRRSLPSEFPVCGPPLEKRGFEVVGPDIPADAVELLHIRLPSESGYGQEVARCPVCATTVWSYYPSCGRFLKFVRVGTLDQSWQVDPDVHIYTRSKREFVTLAEEGAPRFSAFYPKIREIYREESIRRFEEMLPTVNEYRRDKGLQELKI
ncbi:hypothetical protein GQ53DRAFT_797813 [Thozetella sp. PMI_491]|nr:hypothetical protein GQ53DRAFT_797813 [Thozetella sp. PMI_491]